VGHKLEYAITMGLLRAAANEITSSQVECGKFYSRNIWSHQNSGTR
jgi:hypothetical protein